MLDVGSGNSKFLYALNGCGILEKGYGVEISKSRNDFANRWRDDLGISNVININDNIFNIDLEPFPKFDLIYCSDIVFQFFDPVRKDSGVKFLKNIFKRMNNYGVVLLELYDHDKILKSMRNNEIKLWEEFEEPDPWRYSLWDCKYEDLCISLKKTFVKRDLSETYISTVILRNYTRQESIALLENCGFQNIELYECWENDGDLSEDEFIVLGRKHD